MSTVWNPHFESLNNKNLETWLAGLPRTVAPKKTIIVASEERSGSEWLCQLMCATGRLGRPSEYLNAPWFRRFVPDYPEDVPAGISVAQRAGTTPNGCFAIKLHPWHFDKLQEARAEGKMTFAEAFPNPCFVRIIRRDILGQAISLSRARQSGSYHAHVEATGRPVFNADEITGCIREIATNRERWELYFARNGLTPLVIEYETLMRAPAKSIRDIARYAKIPLGLFFRKPAKPIEIQRNTESAEWRAAYLKVAGDPGYLDRV
ncbi:Stf0 family sulfotransferase [Acetobacter oeni]|uniref:Sulphotransferase Stf0 domain-containing protein n=1 Tax=Acetobacter oeni TaxID=304077 RepID=A0A511XNT0_9PROT|nr:Stf0 family sulfotransferase [Acetobacter oeni]MBB3881633.1 LPS sulfotransferase NodH [Acetobacter oeni]GBR00972.1 Stf0 sulfotransferase [Acetobacter oeni LMG 21952]GEN64612.1 hypothetical protein AOE01nite_28360 [Acetobacter oeni]